MTALWLKLNRHALIGLADALKAGRLFAPYFASSVIRHVPASLCQEVTAELNRLDATGATPAHIAYTLTALAAEREASQQIRDRVELVWTGQELIGSQSRDTGVVVQELFSLAKTSVLISSFAIDRGDKARALFQSLATRMDQNPNLQVRMFLNVQRPYQNIEPDSVLLRKFATSFRNEVWYGKRLPQVFHDPRSLAAGTDTKASLHAKCIVVDEQYVLITSANFTEAAHERNIEAGVLLVDPPIAQAVRSQFETLVTRDILQRVPGL